MENYNYFSCNLETISLSFGSKPLHFQPNSVHLCALYVGSECYSTLRALLVGSQLNNIEKVMMMTVNDYQFKLEFFITADHKAHQCLGECDGPSSKKIWRRPCPYCEITPKKMHHPIVGEAVQNVKETLKDGALFPNIPMSNRPPDLLHLVANVCKWLLKWTSRSINPNYTKKMHEKWCHRTLEPFLNKVKKLSATSWTPQSSHSAYWEFMKEGWPNLVNMLQEMEEQREVVGTVVLVGHKRKRTKLRNDTTF